MDEHLPETVGCLCLASRRAARAITRKFDSALRVHGLKATQFSLLAALELKGPQTIGALAQFIGADRTTLTRNLALMEEQALVSIRNGEDARAHVVSIDRAGRQKLKGAFRAWSATQKQLTNALGADAAESLRRISGQSAALTRSPRDSKELSS